MITGIDHIAIIVSSEKSIEFYKNLGFVEVSRIDRGYDTIVFMSGFGVTLEIFIDATHPKRVTNPEALGLRHLAFKVDDLTATIQKLNIIAEPIRENNGKKFTFFKDPDGLPIELRE